MALGLALAIFAGSHLTGGLAGGLAGPQYDAALRLIESAAFRLARARMSGDAAAARQAHKDIVRIANTAHVTTEHATAAAKAGIRKAQATAA